MTSLPHYDPIAPMPALNAAGVRYQKSETSSTLSIEGQTFAGASTAGEKWTFALPYPAAVKAAFGKEGVVQKLAKIFSKELQTGDAGFDDKVYVRTADENTARFLQNEDVRNLIAEFVGEGGTVTIDGQQMMVHAVNAGLAAIVSEKDIARLVCHAMAFR